MKRLAWLLALGLAVPACATAQRPPEDASAVETPAAAAAAPAAPAPVAAQPDGAAAKKQRVKGEPKVKSKAKAKLSDGGGGDVTERLARIEKMVAAVLERIDAKTKGAAGDEALQKKMADVKETARRMETERGELKTRVKQLERELAGLREECDALRAKLAATK